MKENDIDKPKGMWLRQSIQDAMTLALPEKKFNENKIDLVEINIMINNLGKNFEDFKTDEGRELMQQYLEALQEFEDIEEELSEQRKEYNRKPSPSLASEIRGKENMYKTKYERVNKIRNRIYKIEK